MKLFACASSPLNRTEAAGNRRLKNKRCFFRGPCLKIKSKVPVEVRLTKQVFRPVSHLRLMSQVSPVVLDVSDRLLECSHASLTTSRTLPAHPSRPLLTQRSHPHPKFTLVKVYCRHRNRMRTGKRNRHRRPDSPDPNPKSKRDDISINQLT
ncbi:hypothetical protein EVAR_36784_1 [Eumeta japonica]|uniref:Uncharacterized protein n=1 Tax=Eumeta variegata TaxID=151549 RepID=A0A4C1X019_EUMVA|nr:hypothetical protein EVAR_36784_1 [Eumeta japonica]